MSRRCAGLALLALAGAAAAQPATYSLDPTHTFVHFEADHLGVSTLRGRFDKKDGSVSLDRAAGSGRAEITIDMASVSTGVPALDRHLSGAEHFDVAQHPTARFVGERFSFKGDQVTEVAGTLTLLGRSQPVTLKARQFNCYTSPLFKREVCGGDFETTLKRSAFGMTAGAGIVPDDIRLLVQIEAIKR